MRVVVRLFAGLRERAGVDRIEVELADGATVGDLLAALPGTSVGDPEPCIVAVNREYAAETTRLSGGDEVALVPPVSGGAGLVRRVEVSGEPLDAAALRAEVSDPRAGGVEVFEGVTREVAHLDYEAYEEMALPLLRAIAAEEGERHGACAVAVAHRFGRVALGEPSVVVAVSGPHRDEAFGAARAIIDRLKAEVPLWKKEEGTWVAEGLPRPPGGSGS